MAKIGLFGGSFDPPHKDHVRTLEGVCKKVKLHEIWILPNRVHRFKKHSTKLIDIVGMCECAFPPNIGSIKIFLDMIDVEMNFGGSTYELVNFLKDTNPQHSFYIIMGSDCACDIDKWDNYKRLISENIFIIVDRMPCFDQWKSKKCWNKGTWISINDVYGVYSSSHFKEFLSHVPKSVLRYIYENKLYIED